MYSFYCSFPTCSTKTGLLMAVAAFLVLVPWFEGSKFSTNEFMVDGVATSAIVVLVVAIAFSLVSWLILSAISKDIKLLGIALGIITGAAMVIPFLQVLGPMAGVIVGAVAGFVAFLLQKKIANPTENRPLTAAAATLAATYFVVIAVVLTVQSTTMLDTGDGIGAWSGTADGLESSGFANILHSGIGFVFFPVVISSLIMTILIVRNKK